MFEFLKGILSELISMFQENDNSKETKYKKIVYIIILICAVFFIGLLIFYMIKAFPTFTQSIQENYNDSKELLDKNIKIR